MTVATMGPDEGLDEGDGSNNRCTKSNMSSDIAKMIGIQKHTPKLLVLTALLVHPTNGV